MTRNRNINATKRVSPTLVGYKLGVSGFPISYRNSRLLTPEFTQCWLRKFRPQKFPSFLPMLATHFFSSLDTCHTEPLNSEYWFSGNHIPDSYSAFVVEQHSPPPIAAVYSISLFNVVHSSTSFTLHALRFCAFDVPRPLAALGLGENH